MATYVMSDIHGYLNRVKDLLRQVSFGDGDELFVLGDVIDRGPQSAEALVWAVEEAPRNIHFLMGNHEDMMLAVLKKDVWAFTKQQNSDWGWYEPWGWNGGEETMQQLCDITTADWRTNVLIPWLSELPFKFDVTCGDSRFMMVHAGLAQGLRRDDDIYEQGINKLVNIPEYGKVNAQLLLWVRSRWLDDEVFDVPYDVIFGHTPTFYWVDMLRCDQKAGWFNPNIEIEGEPNKISKLIFPNGRKKICIDTGRSCLGMLRLDDMKEFYSEVDCNG